jgi:large subunit ribosomal protein L15
MTQRFRRKKNKVRGERTHSKGDTKNNRGGGSRGGRGRAGATKGKIFSIGQKDKRKYRLKAATKGKSVSLGYLNEKVDDLVAKGKITKEKDSYIVDKTSGYEKVLGQGNINKKLILRINASKSAIEKIKAAKGKFEFDKKGFDAEDDVDFEEDEDSE